MKPEESKWDCLKSASIYHSTFHPVVGRITAPHDVHTLIPWNCDQIALQGKRNFADAIKVKDLEMGDYPGLS